MIELVMDRYKGGGRNYRKGRKGREEEEGKKEEEGGIKGLCVGGVDDALDTAVFETDDVEIEEESKR